MRNSYKLTMLDKQGRIVFEEYFPTYQQASNTANSLKDKELHSQVIINNPNGLGDETGGENE